ncbi:phage head-tail connector protein [Tianweitania sp. BSSL-BM11]|uniref:Phage head-tail connector protein n=1 Tax=Tianweitania aestuarii TaxID=2814886 RepID=A0ABS5RSV5_9HYPH|nr:head-tail connector protein [Tianweitania aestuarii]MBS9719885.1 phage head-tail connector protein [Tianweitania aestuarii]
MTLFRTVEPAAEPVTVADVKAHLRLDHASEDGLIVDLIRAAREEVEQATGCALIEQSWRLTLDRWPQSNRVLIHKHPVKQILSVTIYGREGGAAIVDPAIMLLDGRSRPARLHFDQAPQPGRAMNGIEVDFTAGFGPAGTDVPDLLKRAVIMLASHWFEFRAVLSARDQPASYPKGYERLIGPYRSRRL